MIKKKVKTKQFKSKKSSFSKKFYTTSKSKNVVEKPFIVNKNISIDSSNPMLLYLESLFAILYKGTYKNIYILKQLNLSTKYSDYLDKFLEVLTKYTLLKVSSSVFKLNLKFIKNTKVPKYFLLKVTSKNSLGEYLAKYPNFIRHSEKFTIVVDNTYYMLKENCYILAKLNKVNNKILKASVLTMFPEYTPEIITGLVKVIDNTYYLVPLGRKYKSNLKIVNSDNLNNVKNNALIKGEVVKDLDKGSYVINTKVINNKDLTNDLSLLTAYEFNLKPEFSKEVLDYTNSISILPKTSNYIDLRSTLLVTIDGEDAKDFDDAVFVKKISDKPLKYKATVAIADVSYYVKDNSVLDNEAKVRGNSTYLPGLVIPMLPHTLSNHWCSLNCGEDRAVLAVDLIINSKGLVEKYNFYKAIINSKARFTYKEIEEAINNKLTPKTEAFVEKVIKPLYKCWQLLNNAKVNRSALEIQSNEFSVTFNKDNTVKDIIKKEELVAHKIIEELMISANVAATNFLKSHNLSDFIIYRNHEKPSLVKLETFSTVLKALSIKTKIPANITPKFFNDLLKKYSKTKLITVLNEAVLSSQSQAKYSTYNVGHFGLSLKEYCHFTSPIRRYADLIIHRLISSVLDNKKVILNKYELEQTANYISLTERNSSSAEHSAIEKVIAKLLSNKINYCFKANIVNITNAGIFVALECFGAQGLVPMRTLGNERFIFSKNKDKLIGTTSKKTYKVGQSTNVILKEVNILKGLLTFLIKE